MDEMCFERQILLIYFVAAMVENNKFLHHDRDYIFMVFCMMGGLIYIYDKQ